jgi:thiamine-phosphate pyrophosphorylase
MQQIGYAVEAGVDVLQIREHDIAARQLLSLVVDTVRIVRRRNSGCRVVVNDRLDVALAAGADGVHLRGDSPAPHIVRRNTPPGFIIGRSVHSLDEASAVARAVDYLIAGTVWPTPSKKGEAPLLGVAGLAAIARAVDVPVLAVGGVTLERLSDVARQGAAGIAAIGLFMAQGAQSAPGALDDEGAAECRAVGLHAIVREARERFDSLASCF